MYKHIMAKNKTSFKYMLILNGGPASICLPAGVSNIFLYPICFELYRLGEFKSYYILQGFLQARLAPQGAAI